jgi:hypothetical protein
VHVEHLQINKPRSGSVSSFGDRSGQRLLARLRGERDDLSRLDVGAEPDEQLSQRADVVGGLGHR